MARGGGAALIKKFLALGNNYLAVTALVAAGCAFAFYAWQRDIGLDLWDEGFLWYGVQRTMLGEVPVLDFFAYDPGRYYWSAAIMLVLDDAGLLALRIAGAAIQAIGLFFGLLALGTVTKKEDRFFILIAAITLVIWMFPRHKYFDITALLALIFVFTWLVQRADLRRYFIAGLTVGIVAVFGKNHGVYGLTASALILGYLWLERSGPGLLKSISALSAGIAAGYAPVLILMVMQPGFTEAFWQSIVFLLTGGAAIIPVNIPWPWRVSFGDKTIIGLVFLAVFVWAVVGIPWILWLRYKHKHVPALWVSCAALGLPYAHAVSLRADIPHLSQALYPVLLAALGGIAMQRPAKRMACAGFICLLSIVVMLGRHPGWDCRPGKECAEVELLGDRLKLPPSVDRDMKLLNSLNEQYAAPARTFFVAPFWPGAYAAFEKKAPVWEVYAFATRDDAFQRREIARIEAANPGFVLIYDLPLDGRDELRYSRSHALIAEYVEKNYVLLEGYSENPAYRIYASKQNRQ
ncbi:conserved hypothetical protein [Parvibaculum lavamentivorans DS-1]|uniref:Glycosyltransferase RgtA/B/C/D-like domain-containing protein n=2 Tax=Parvibaculum lavamentivorans TaxID=256618 RepID=A7HYD4_PARL1|nr:conserved hypothetical protein [Parvibaculum lavamentivorans DS-1]